MAATDHLIMSAIALAKEAHSKATRRYSDKPYITHPLRVMGMVAIHDKVTELEIAAAVLHDTHEDPPYIPLERIAEEIHPQVSAYVRDLTNPSKFFQLPSGQYLPEWPRARRKQFDRDHLSTCDYWTQTIKAYDRIDNLTELMHDLISPGKKPSVDFVRLYYEESWQLNRILTKVDEWLRKSLYHVISLLRSLIKN